MKPPFAYYGGKAGLARKLAEVCRLCGDR